MASRVAVPVPRPALNPWRAGRDTGTATLEAKLLQQLVALREEVLYVIFLDLTKAYDALDKSRCLEILEGYGVGPNARRLMINYWRRLTMVLREGGLPRNGIRRRERRVALRHVSLPSECRSVVTPLSDHHGQAAPVVYH